MKDRINRPEEPKLDPIAELKKYSDELMEKEGPHNWILNESGEVVPASFFEWVFWFEKGGQRLIQKDYFDDHLVSTIFEGIDLVHSIVPNHRPIVFETMVFGPAEPTEWFDGQMKMIRPSLWSKRDCTLQEALATHAKAIEWLKDYLNAKAHKS